MSPQAQAVYQILLRNNAPLSAKDLSGRLKIVPNSMYRLIEELIGLGLITKTGTYPHLFMAKPADEGLSMFLLQQHSWFSSKFSKAKNIESKQISFSFVQSRDELMRLSVGETIKATKSIDLLRSGGEIPADLILEMIESQKRGVVTRMLIQDYNKENKAMVHNWIKNGFQVRVTPLRHVRLMIYDDTTIYFMSYRHSNDDKDMGMKITYPPFAIILSNLFDGWWRKGKVISS